MIIRKPYAFLVKHFRKIHIVLLIIGIYLFYKTIDVARFVNDFMSYGVYDLYANPITKHITFLMQISILLMMIGSASLVLLLRHKGKPWKGYVFPTALYLVLFFTIAMIKSFFRTYTEIVPVTNLRLSRDLLMIFMFAQLPALAIFSARILGIDIKKFHFNSDLQSLELSEEDREEIEIGLNIDGYTFVRWWRKFVRNLGYFYKEHKKISITLIVLVLGYIFYNSYITLFVNNRTYKQGQIYNANGYTITVKNTYFTDKDNKGEIITEDSNFVIVELDVKNNHEARNLDTSKFHLKAGTKDFTTTEKTYAHEFEDIGISYNKVRKLKKDETLTFIIIYKVNKNIRKGRFVLFYQEDGGIFKLRKIKLKVKDIRKINPAQTLNIGDFIDIKLQNKEESLSFDSYEIQNSIEYKTNKCTTTNCDIKLNSYQAPIGYKILKLDFGSDSYEAKNVIDFLGKYGKIDYKDTKNEDSSIGITFAVDKNYFGKVVYIKIPDEVSYSEELALHLIIRNQEIIYKLS